MDRPATAEELDELEARIDGVAGRAAGDEPGRSPPSTGASGDERRWFVRLRGEEKDVFTIWFTLRQRTLHYETYVMPAPEENHEALLRAPAAAQPQAVRRARSRSATRTRSSSSASCRSTPSTRPSSTASSARSTPTSSSSSARRCASASPVTSSDSHCFSMSFTSRVRAARWPAPLGEVRTRPAAGAFARSDPGRGMLDRPWRVLPRRSSDVTGSRPSRSPSPSCWPRAARPATTRAATRPPRRERREHRDVRDDGVVHDHHRARGRRRGPGAGRGGGRHHRRLPGGLGGRAARGSTATRT